MFDDSGSKHAADVVIEEGGHSRLWAKLARAQTAGGEEFGGELWAAFADRIRKKKDGIETESADCLRVNPARRLPVKAVAPIPGWATSRRPSSGFR